VRLSIEGVVVACGNHATMQAHHRHMQEQVPSHTVSLVDLNLEQNMWGGMVLVMLARVGSTVTQTQIGTEKCAHLGRESTAD
jgi:acyl-CoA hydrolase